MNGQKFRIALLGLGRMGRNHLRVTRLDPQFELVAVVDPVANMSPADLGGAQLLRSIDELDKIDYDCAIIATPSSTHFEVAERLIRAGKHLLVEKPLCTDAVGAAKLVEQANKAGVKMAVGHVERFNPAVRKLREVIRAGFLGTPIHFSVTRVGGYPENLLPGNNVLLDLAVHDIDVVRSLIGPVKVEASICHSTVKEGVLDTAEVFLASPTGPTASVHVNWITPTKIRSIRVTGTRGVCFVDYILQTCELLGGTLLQSIQPTNPDFGRLLELYRNSDKITFGVNKEEPLRVQLSQFGQFLTNGDRGELCVGADAVAAVLLAERSIKLDQRRQSEDDSVKGSEVPSLDAVFV
ncbi:MAG: Gfo/Idh/MocA family oxidoreductase [Deltaproteobacteria bacterium]|nr:Gfo/Idh/MocA family oxidoreductase [Deltaproteobacteria bacterium]